MPEMVQAGAALRVTVKVEPLVEIVRRHVRSLTAVELNAIRSDFLHALDMTQVAVAHVSRSKRAASPEFDDPVLSSQEAADLVGVSRPYMVARIDAGDVPLHQQVGNQRRVLKSAVMAWQKKAKARQRRALAELSAALDDEIFSD